MHFVVTFPMSNKFTTATVDTWHTNTFARKRKLLKMLFDTSRSGIYFAMFQFQVYFRDILNRYYSNLFNSYEINENQRKDKLIINICVK